MLRLTPVFTVFCVGCDHFTALELDRVRAVSGALENQADQSVGLVELSDEFKSLSIDGNVLVADLDEEIRGYLFITWRGKGQNMRGVLYLSDTKPSLFSEDYYGNTIVTVGVPPIRHSDTNTVPVDFTVVPTGTDRVFQVSHSLD